MAEQKELDKLRAQDQRKIKANKSELQRQEKALAEAAALVVLQKSGMSYIRRMRKADQRLAPADGDQTDWRGQCCGRWPSDCLRGDQYIPENLQQLAEGFEG